VPNSGLLWLEWTVIWVFTHLRVLPYLGSLSALQCDMLRNDGADSKYPAAVVGPMDDLEGRCSVWSGPESWPEMPGGRLQAESPRDSLTAWYLMKRQTMCCDPVLLALCKTGSRIYTTPGCPAECITAAD